MKPRLTESQKCHCTRPVNSGRSYFRYFACLLCGLLIAGRS